MRSTVYEIINTNSHLTVSGLWGGAGAGGAMMPLAADYIGREAYHESVLQDDRDYMAPSIGLITCQSVSGQAEPLSLRKSHYP